MCVLIIVYCRQIFCKQLKALPHCLVVLISTLKFKYSSKEPDCQCSRHVRHKPALLYSLLVKCEATLLHLEWLNIEAVISVTLIEQPHEASGKTNTNKTACFRRDPLSILSVYFSVLFQVFFHPSSSFESMFCSFQHFVWFLSSESSSGRRQPVSQPVAGWFHS